MKTVVSIDFDIIMAPSIELYNNMVPSADWNSLLNDPYMQLLTIDTNHYSKIFSYVMRCANHMKKENIHFIEDHGQASKFITEPCKLFNIDHHHDLGYKEDNSEEEKINCSNWVSYLHRENLITDYIWIKNVNSVEPLESPDWLTCKDFINYKLDDIPIPDELIICLSEPWVPYSYRPLFYLLMDYCNDKFDTHYNILMDRCTQ